MTAVAFSDILGFGLGFRVVALVLKVMALGGQFGVVALFQHCRYRCGVYQQLFRCASSSCVGYSYTIRRRIRLPFDVERHRTAVESPRTGIEQHGPEVE